MKVNGNKRTNTIIEDHGKWLLVDVSTPTFQNVSMAVETDVFKKHLLAGKGKIYTEKANGNLYARYRFKDKLFLLHRDVINTNGNLDHINHYDRFIDNRKSNLRVATYSQNSMNRKTFSSSESGITGVRLRKDSLKWRAVIYINGKCLSLGSFLNKADAITARKKAEQKYFGEFAFSGQTG